MTREVAIKAIQDFIGWFKEDSLIRKALEMAIQALSQEPCEKCRNKRTSFCGNCEDYDEYEQQPCEDAVSRQAVIYYIKGHIHEIITESGADKNAHTNSILKALINGVETMPTVNPQPCDDAISRDAVMGLVAREHTEWDDLYIDIAKLPSVTQKLGKWIKGKCSICGEHAPFWSMSTTYYESEYCPNCGAKMESEEISERNMKMWEGIFKAESEDKE